MRKAGEKSTVQRRVIILQMLEEKGQVDVTSLSKELMVSEVTVRNDLKRLEQKNALIRARGGAMKIDRVGTDFAISDKNKQNYEQKKRIGKAAAALIEEGDTIILDSGTTTMEITKNLSTLSELTVITNALNIADQLAEHPKANVIVPGGFLRKNSLSLIGSTAEESFKNYFLRQTFSGRGWPERSLRSFDTQCRRGPPEPGDDIHFQASDRRSRFQQVPQKEFRLHGPHHRHRHPHHR
jgi:DeoR family transcriptional regulator of aga operon